MTASTAERSPRALVNLMSTKGKLLRLLNTLLLSEGAILEARPLDRHFRLLTVRADPAVAAKWQPGDKVQVLLPDDEVRTYTPARWSADGVTSLLVYVRDDSPASRWARHAEAGARLRFVGPQRSLVMPSGPISLLGDETSLAVSASYAVARPGQVRVILEVDVGTPVTEALAALGLEAQVVPRARGAPRGQALAAALPSLDGPVGITGGAELVQRARAELRGRGLRELKTKAYWVEGRRGLD